MDEKKVMIDSGAFSVWSKGVSIDLRDYIRWCKQNLCIDYFVNLDVLPYGKGLESVPKERQVQESAKRRWENYQEMVSSLPIEKVIPVFHQGEPLEWLQKYLEFGSPYIGISPDKEVTLDRRLEWLNSLRPVVLSKGKVKAKYHCFGFVSREILNLWEWESCDSTSPIVIAGMGSLVVPKKRGDCFDFSDLFEVDATDRVPETEVLEGGLPIQIGDGWVVKDGGKHLLNLSPTVKEMVFEYLDMLGMPLGEREVIKVPKGYKLRPGERWANKSRDKIIRVVVRGVLTDDQVRKYVNIDAFQQMVKTTKTKHLYVSGSISEMWVERTIKCRLFSFLEVRNSSVGKVLHMFLEGKK